MLTLDKVEIRQGDFLLCADWTVEASSTVAIIGPSGAGKSTLLNAVAGFVPLAAGQLRLDNQDISDQPPHARPISVLFQDNNLFPHLSAAQNVGLGLRPSGRFSASETEQIEAALTRVGLEGLGARKPAALSGGQQSRVALARVLLQQNPLILLDEPFAALGPALKIEMLELVAELAGESKATLLMVSHAPDDARQIAAKTVVVMDGRADAPQPTEALLDNPPPKLQAYLG